MGERRGEEMERVLLVEDEKRMRDIVRDYFAAHKLECDLARDGEEALDALGALTGRTAKEEIVSGIFSRFCVGK